MKKIKQILKYKKVWIPLTIIALIGIVVTGACYAGYCKTEQPKKVERVVYTLPRFNDPFIDIPFFADIHNHFENVWRGFDQVFPKAWFVHRTVNTPRIDMIEKEKSIEITAELPGFKKESISISIQDNHLLLEANKESEKEEKKDSYYLQERQSGALRRILKLPYYANTTEATSSFTNGVLTISIPKKTKTEIETKEIKIQ